MEQELCHILKQTEESYIATHPGTHEKRENWQVWYSQWLLMFFDLESIFGYVPSNGQLQFSLLQGEIAFTAGQQKETWSQYVGSRMYQLLAKKKNSD